MLLPVDLREWIPKDDLVHFVIEAVEGMDLQTANPPAHLHLHVHSPRLAHPGPGLARDKPGLDQCFPGQDQRIPGQDQPKPGPAHGVRGQG